MNTIFINFFLRRDRANSRGEFPIYCRVTISGDREHFSTNEYVHPDKWEYKVIKNGKEQVINEQKVLGKGVEAKAINERLDVIKSKLKSIFNKLDQNDELITASLIKNIYEGKGSARRQTLLKALDFAISEMNALVEKKKKKKTTVDRYEYTKNNVADFVKYKYGKEDVFLQDMLIKGRPEFSFAADYEQYGKTVTTDCKKVVWKHNYCKKELGRINTMLITAVRNGWLDRNPMAGYPMKTKKGKPQYLKADQVQLIEDTKFTSEGLSRVKDVFLFCCYTSLSYAEVKKLNYDEHFAYGIDGHDWIFINRKKNESDEDAGKICKIPLLDEAKKYLRKYKDDPECISKGVAMPVLSNFQYNKYLKMIRDYCNEEAAREGLQVRLGMDSKFSTHIARHTCSRWLLDLGYSKEFVAEIFGHADTKLIGEIYGEITTTRMSLEINYVNKKLHAS